MIPPNADRRAAIQSDMAYHQARVLLLVNTISKVPGTGRKLDGLTKLAKLDFLVRYPALALRVVEQLRLDERFHPTDDDKREAEAPMVRYKYGPWDDRYYPVIGALVGKGLLSYTRGRQGSVALRPTADGKRVATELASGPAWSTIAVRCEAIARCVGSQTGNQLKELIYARLPEVMDRPHREVIRP